MLHYAINGDKFQTLNNARLNPLLGALCWTVISVSLCVLDTPYSGAQSNYLPRPKNGENN